MKVAAINDLSGFGKCSLTADMTVLAAMGIECCPLPTAVLSAQTGYPSFYSKDLTGIIPEYLREWKKQNEIFDGVITGFMMSSLQASNSLEFIRAFKSENSKILVDPVMGDDGITYKNFSKELLEMRLLNVVGRWGDCEVVWHCGPHAKIGATIRRRRHLCDRHRKCKQSNNQCYPSF